MLRSCISIHFANGHNMKSRLNDPHEKPLLPFNLSPNSELLGPVGPLEMFGRMLDKHSRNKTHSGNPAGPIASKQGPPSLVDYGPYPTTPHLTSFTHSLRARNKNEVKQMILCLQWLRQLLETWKLVLSGVHCKRCSCAIGVSGRKRATATRLPSIGPSQGANVLWQKQARFG